MAKAKKVDVFTPEIRSNMKEAYLQAANDSERYEVVEYFAEKVGNSVASVRMVMSRAGYYIKKSYTTKKGDKAEKKAEKVAKIAEKLSMMPELADSLEKANANILDAILAKFAAYENDILALTKGMEKPSE